MIKKLYGGFTIGFCLLFTLIGLILIVYPISGNIIKPPYNEEKAVLFQTIQTVIALLALMPPPVALVSYYLSGAIGKNWFSRTLLLGLVITFVLLVLTIFYVIFTYLMLEIGRFDESMFNRFTVQRIIFGTLNFTIFPLIFMITALVVQKVSLWKRFLPMMSFVLAIIITIIMAMLIYAIVSITRSESIYSGAKDATLTHWILLGSVAWSLIGLAVFWKHKEPIENGLDGSTPFTT